MTTEKDIAQRLLKEEWPNHPKKVNSNNLIDLTKQIILSDSNIDCKKRETMSISGCYGYKSSHGGFFKNSEIYIGTRKLTEEDIATENFAKIPKIL